MWYLLPRGPAPLGRKLTLGTCSPGEAADQGPPLCTPRWAFNSSSEVMDIPGSRVRAVGKGRSQVSYTPRRHQDYGSLLCWATNDVGVQRQPCIYHVIHAGGYTTLLTFFTSSCVVS